MISPIKLAVKNKMAILKKSYLHANQTNRFFESVIMLLIFCEHLFDKLISWKIVEQNRSKTSTGKFSRLLL